MSARPDGRSKLQNTTVGILPDPPGAVLHESPRARSGTIAHLAREHERWASDVRNAQAQSEVERPVAGVRRDPGARSVRGAGDGARRTLCHMPRALNQARAQTRVAQRGAAELVRCPARGVESRAGRQCRRARRREARAPGRVEFVQIHGLARLGGGMGVVLASPPAGLTDPHPVRRAKARPVCSRSSTNVSSSHGRWPCRRSKSSPTRRATWPSTCEARLRQQTPGRIRNRHNPTTR